MAPPGELDWNTLRNILLYRLRFDNYLKPFSYWFILNSIRTIAILVFLFQKKFIKVTMCLFFNQKQFVLRFHTNNWLQDQCIFTKFISLLGNRLWRDERIQAFILCLFEAGQKTIPSILMVPQALWWVFDLELSA